MPKIWRLCKVAPFFKSAHISLCLCVSLIDIDSQEHHHGAHTIPVDLHRSDYLNIIYRTPISSFHNRQYSVTNMQGKSQNAVVKSEFLSLKLMMTGVSLHMHWLYCLLSCSVSAHCPGGLHQAPLLSKQGQKSSSPVQPNLSPEKGSPTKSPPHPPKGFNPNAPTFVPMGLQTIQRPANVSVRLN